MGERVRSHACTRIAKLLSGHTKLERNLAGDLLDARRERDKARKALARFPTLIEITGALVPGANPGLTARLIADYNSAEIARAAEGGGDE